MPCQTNRRGGLAAIATAGFSRLAPTFSGETMDPYAEPDEAAPPPRPQRGCLWGCLGTLIAAVVVIAAVYSYGAWYLFKGFSNDPRIQAVAAAVKANDEAVSVLGRDIRVMAVKKQTYEHSTGKGSIASYTLTVVGSNGEAEVMADLDVSAEPAKITSLVLTDSDGHRHYLIGGAPPNPMMQNSI